MNVAAKKDDIARFLGNRLEEKRPRAKTISDSAFARATREAVLMMESGDWSAAVPRHFVALYALLHEKVYGVRADELTPSARLVAAGLARGMCDRLFGGDPGEMAGYMRWVWAREKDREAWRRANQKDGGRIGARLVFGGALVTEYRLHLARTGQLK